MKPVKITKADDLFDMIKNMKGKIDEKSDVTNSFCGVAKLNEMVDNKKTATKITAKECIKLINQALKQFGEYSYGDKGASEVMDIDDIASRLQTMTAKEIIAVLTEVEQKHKNPDPFISDVLYALQSWDSKEAEELFNSQIAQEYL